MRRVKKVRRKPSNYEQETIINFNKAEDIAHIFTYEKTWQQHLEKRLGLKPTMDNGYSGRSYELLKKLMRLPQPKKRLSEATKQRLADNLAAARKGNLSAKNRNALAKLAEKSSGE